MKKFIVITLVLVLVALSACTAKQILSDTQTQIPGTQTPTIQTPDTNTQTPEIISRERAIELALQAAKVDKASAFDIEAELDRERAGKIWEVDFETREHEFSYDINATDGTVTKVEREIND